MTFTDFCSTHPPIHQEIVLQDGCFSVTRYWFKGEVRGLTEFGCVKLVENGWQGKETTVDVQSIKPVVIFEVVEARDEAAAA